MSHQKNLFAIEISWSSLFKIFLFLFILYLVFLIREILYWIFLASILSLLFEPIIDFFSRKKIPRWLSALLTFLFIFGTFAFLIYYLSLPLLFEIQKFTTQLPLLFEKFSPPLKGLGLISFETFEELTLSLQKWLLQSSRNIISVISTVFGGIFAAFSIFSFSFFLSIEKNSLENFLGFLFGERIQFFLKIWEEVKESTFKWFGIKLLGSFLVALLTYVSLVIFKVPYPLSLSLLAGVTNFVPILGPIFSGTLIFLIALSYSIKRGIFVLFSFILIQQIEGNLFSPILSSKILKMPPFLVLFSLLVGGKLMGIVGAILAIPLFGVFFNFLRKIFQK